MIERVIQEHTNSTIPPASSKSQGRNVISHCRYHLTPNSHPGTGQLLDAEVIAISWTIDTIARPMQAQSMQAQPDTDGVRIATRSAIRINSVDVMANFVADFVADFMTNSGSRMRAIGLPATNSNRPGERSDIEG
nr:MAG: hypothetical protein EDM05_22050 [Leptolyngbya sp. IPPAS B-1204]